MNSFEFYNPVRVIFGNDKMDRLGELAAQYGKKALLVKQKSKSLERLGIYDRAKKLLIDAGMEVYELEGVVPNPRISSVREGAEICKKNGIDIVIAVGGGSCIDCAKAICIAAKDDGDVWDFFTLKRTAKDALPLGVVSTLAGTGSEMNVNAVITNEETKKKWSIHYEMLYPKFAIIDPKLQLSVSPKVTAATAFDIVSHCLESYFDSCPNTPLQDGIDETIMRTTMECARILVKTPDDLEARTNFCWCSTLALNGLTDAGKNGDPYDAHTIEHEIGALYDVPHGEGLAVVQPAWLKVKAKKDPRKFVQLAERVFGIDKSGKEDLEVAFEAIDALKQWAKEIGNRTTLKELGVEKDRLEEIVEGILSNPEGRNLDRNDVMEALLDCYE
ncbi:MAG: iron-containing alcohol dehydrogenase [Clostridiaceae bacterium]|nr:iron-containing alcohol dehydrogenase [Clostridiaceae bacterium]